MTCPNRSVLGATHSWMSAETLPRSSDSLMPASASALPCKRGGGAPFAASFLRLNKWETETKTAIWGPYFETYLHDPRTIVLVLKEDMVTLEPIPVLLAWWETWDCPTYVLPKATYGAS